jgi:hypothetical protein
MLANNSGGAMASTAASGDTTSWGAERWDDHELPFSQHDGRVGLPVGPSCVYNAGELSPTRQHAAHTEAYSRGLVEL